MDFSRSVLFTVLVGIVLAHNIQLSRGCAPSCNEGGAAGGSGSGDSTLVVPTANSKTIQRVMVSSVEQARVRGACHSICITTSNVRYEYTTSLPLWPAVRELNQSRCSRISFYLQCLDGCVSRGFHHAGSSISNTQCQDDCTQSCNSTCFNLGTCNIGTKCSLGCNGGGCRIGCREGRSLNVSVDQQAAAPLNSNINLLLTSTAGSFLLDTQATQPNNTITLSSVHSFVVRIDGTGDGDNITSYWWMRDFEVTELDLSEFICKEVELSFAVINQHGVSDFSPIKRTCVEGSALAPPPNIEITFEEKVKDRLTKRGSFTVNVSWTYPTDLLLSEVQYRIKIVGRRCKDYEIIVPSNITSVSDSGYTPYCDLTIMVSTLFRNDESNPNRTDITLQYPTEILLLSQTPIQDKYTGDYNITLYLSLQRHDPLLLASLISYGVTIFRFGILASNEVKILDNVSNYSTSFLLTPPKDGKEFSFSYLISVRQVDNLQYRGLVRGPFTVFTGSIRGRPPSTVEGAEILNGTVDSVTNRILLDITWESPDPFGELKHYEIVLLSAEFDNPNATVNRTFASRSLSANQTFYTLNSTISQEIGIYLLQIKSENEIGLSQPALIRFNLSDYIPVNETLLTPTPTNKSIKKEDKTTPTYAYYIIGIGGALLIIVLVLVICCCAYTCYVKWANRIVLPPSIKDPWGPLYYDDSGKEVEISLGERPSIIADTWEIGPDHILLGKALGSGFFGEVYRCTIQGPISTPYTERNQLSKWIALPAAVKILKDTATEKMRSDFIKEIELMKRAGMKYNSHVVSMICCTVNEEPNVLVLEYVDHGDLLQYLQKNKVFVIKNKMTEDSVDSNKALPYLEPSDQYSHLAPREMSSPYDHLRKVLSDNDSAIEDPYPDLKQLLPVDMVTFAYQIADGMEYLSSLGIIHRDLACRNVLVGNNKVLKISDFGLARQLNDNLVYYRSTEGKLPIRWMAPEAIRDRVFNTNTDIWSYGVTLWEICTLGAFPYPLLTNRDVLEALLEGQRLERPPNCTENLYEIMLDCWKADPELRPSFSFLKGKTEEMIQNANQDYPYLDFNLNDYLPYCNLRLTSGAASTENILNGIKEEPEEEDMIDKDESNEENDVEKESSPTGYGV
ncbi:uncharacterized protein [Dysidea avara]|uniref:uncharacterized protein n=1 Tax=Dysidea avara TaxID=196820 RepID=UPI0033333609